MTEIPTPEQIKPSTPPTVEQSPVTHTPDTDHHRRVRGRVLGSVAAGLLLFGVNAARNQADTTALAQEPVAPLQLADNADAIVTTTARAWASHQAEDGRFIDPVVGTLPFGVPKTGQAMIEVGAKTNDLELIKAGIRGTIAEIQFPNDEGFNVGLEVAGMANGYNWNQTNLAENPDWAGARTSIVDFLIKRNGRGVSPDNPGLAKCFDNSRCWYNLKLAKAFANTEMKAAGIEMPTGAQIASINQKQHLKTSQILQLAQKNTSDDARYVGTIKGFGKAGILSDPPRNPLAYNAFSSMIMGHVLERKGYATASPALRGAFERSVKTIVGSMAPNGDIGYIGRGQGQVWTLASAADAMSIAAKNTPDGAWRSRYLGGINRVLNRINTIHTPGAWGLPLVPRLRDDTQPDYKGLDSYAQWASYNGTALWGLTNAAKNLRNTTGSPIAPIPSDVPGSFVEPSQAKFATVRNKDLWWAVHASNTHHDARYDFGLVNVQKKNGDDWKTVQPYRPLTKVRVNGSVAMIKNGKRYVPVSSKIRADGKGSVAIDGGWANKPNGEAAEGTDTRWKFDQIGNYAVRLSFKAPEKAKYRFQVWYEKGSKVWKNGRTLKVTEPDGTIQKYELNSPMKVQKDSRTFHSAYDENMGSSVISTTAKPGKTIKYTTSYK